MARITWFPGHMRQAMGALKRVVKGVDLVLEVRDARVRQLSGPALTATAGATHCHTPNSPAVCRAASKSQQFVSYCRCHSLQATLSSVSCSSKSGTYWCSTRLTWSQTSYTRLGLRCLIMQGCSCSCIAGFVLAMDRTRCVYSCRQQQQCFRDGQQAVLGCMCRTSLYVKLSLRCAAADIRACIATPTHAVAAARAGHN
jgi:hypothetical protein